MSNICKSCGGRTSDIGDKGCPHINARIKPYKYPDEREHIALLRNQIWRYERIEDEEGDIAYEAHGPKSSFVRFEGPNAKQDCAIFMNAVLKPPTSR